MEEKKDTLGMLDLVIRPGFCVKENQIIKVNQAAESLFITPGTDIRPLLLTGSEEYAAFTGGCLYLTLSLSSHSCGASVTRVDDIDVFLLEQESDNGELRSMALAARELREPLTNVMITADICHCQIKLPTIKIKINSFYFGNFNSHSSSYNQICQIITASCRYRHLQ